MALTGMDIQAVRQLSTQMTHNADQIDQLSQQLTQALNDVQWLGQDREHFVSDWQSNHVAALKNVSQAIRDAATRANQNASEQEQVSNNG
jgi:outer membrane murein-binding lipoprotein Lpp